MKIYKKSIKNLYKLILFIYIYIYIHLSTYRLCSHSLTHPLSLVVAQPTITTQSMIYPPTTSSLTSPLRHLPEKGGSCSCWIMLAIALADNPPSGWTANRSADAMPWWSWWRSGSASHFFYRYIHSCNLLNEVLLVKEIFLAFLMVN